MKVKKMGNNDTAKVYFGSIQQGQEHGFSALGLKVDRIVESLDFSTIGKGDKVAIKMHLGFNEGYQTVPVFFVRKIVKAVKKVEGWPFITDNPTSVYNASDRGYTQETCGCPLIPIAGVRDRYAYPVDVNFRNVEKLDMAGALHDADVLIDLAHSKGHGSCGYGGAIKNIAIGGYNAESRWERLHGVGESVPYWDSKKCTPEHARKLVDCCPYKALHYDKEKHSLTITMFACRNELCLECLNEDKKVGCLKILPEFFSSFQELMALSARKIIDTFDLNKRFFLNFALQITPHCDCMGMAQPVIVPEIGVLGSRDIVAIEQATLDLIAKAGLIEKCVPPYFKHVSQDARLHPFSRIWGPMKNPYLITEYAEKYGMGKKKYELTEILSPEETAKMQPPAQEYEKAPSFM
jgi:hypothetical protein